MNDLTIDKIDRKLLAILQRDGRVSTVDLAERLGLSPTATSERLKRLTREGFITGYSAKLDPAKLGFGLLVFVEVSLDKTTPDIFDQFSRAVRAQPDILECHMVAGGFDYLVKARAADMTEYRKLLGEMLLSLPGIRETRTYTVMEEVKNDSPLPL